MIWEEERILFFSPHFPTAIRPDALPSVHLKPITKWVPVTVSALSRRSHGKIGECEQSKLTLGQNKNASFGSTKIFNSSSLFYIPWWEY